MSESQSRPSAPRGRGSGRGGRGGYSSSRGGRPKHTNGDAIEPTPTPTVNYDEQGEIGQLKKKHALNIMTIKEMFPQFSEDDIVFALEESNGDIERTVERMTEGNVSQFAEVKKKTKEKSHKDTAVDSTDGFTRSTRSRGGDSGRGGGRARGSDRGRGGRGRARDNVTNRKPTESTLEPAATTGDSWDTPAVETQAGGDGWDQPSAPAEESGWDVVSSSEAEPVAPTTVATTAQAEQEQASSKPDGSRTWASMFAQKSKPKAVVATPKAALKPQVLETPVAATEATEIEAPTTREEPPIEDAASTLPPSAPEPEPEVDITPSEDQLTASNLEQVPGSPQQPATATVVSNAGTNEVRTGSGAITPVPGSSSAQQPLRPGLGGFQTSALKATTPTPRTSSFARRVKEQQESVVMPGNHAVDRTAVQFGSLGLGSSSADLDGDEEQPETRTQPPQHSPVAPKASLPTATQQSQSDATKAASGLPATGPYGAGQDQQSTQAANQTGYQYNQFGNVYGHPGQSGDGASAQKGYEPFGQQATQAGIGSLNGYPSHSQAPGQQSSHQSQFGGTSTAGHDYSSYYGSDQQRNAYNMYGSYGQSQAPQDSAQKTSSAFGTTSASELPATTATSQASHPSQTRFGGVDQSSGHSTPNPTSASQGQGQQGQQGHQGQQGQHPAQSNQHGYPYGGSNQYYGQYYPNYMGQHSYGRDRPPFDDVRRYEEQFLNQSHHYGYGGNQAGYSGAPYGGGKYGQPHQGYGMPSQAWDGQAGSPANTGSYGQGAARDTSTHGTYGRTGSTQPSEGQQQNASAYGGNADFFGRSASGYSAQSSHQQTQQGTDESSRAYGDSSKAGGPSPAPGQTTGRPASTANNQGQSSQAQNQQHYGGYPGQSQYGSQYGQQATSQGHQAGGYGAYSGFGGNNYYANNSSRGNWSGNYGH